MGKQPITIAEYGLGEVHKKLREGCRVIIKSRKTLGYCSARFFMEARDIDSALKIGRGHNTILPNRKGEILEVSSNSFNGDLYPNPNTPEEAYITDLVWYSGGLRKENISMHIEEEDRLEDLLLVEVMPPKK